MRIRTIAAALVFLAATVSGASAQTGSAKTNAALITEINSLFQDNNANLITPFSARQTLLDIIASGGGGGGSISGTTCASPPLNTFQQFINTSSSPSDSFSIWDGNQCIQWATLNTTNHTFALNRINTTNFNTNVAPGTIIHRMNDRVLIGAATLNDGNSEGNNIVKDFIENLRASTTNIAQVAALSTIGQIGILSATRSSDSSGSGSQGAQAFSAFALNDNTTVNNQTVFGMYVESHLFLNVTNGRSLGIEIDAVNRRAVQDITPFNFTPAGLIVDLWLASGGGSGTYSNLFDDSAAIGILDNGSLHRKGIVFKSTALTTSVGAGGSGVAIEMARNQSIRWLNSTPTTDSEIWANASGLTVSTPILSGVNGGAGGGLTLNGATSGSGSITVTATAGTLSLNTATIFSNGGITTGLGGLAVNGSYGTQTPATLTGTSGTITNTSTIINSSGAFTATLPAASGFSGQWLYILNVAANTVTSASSNVTPRTSTTAGTAIITATAGGWVSLQSDGTNWRTMAGTP